MSVWHGDSRKKKSSAGRKRAYRKKRRYEQGSFPAETSMGKSKVRISRGRGRNLKLKALSEESVCVTDLKSGETKKVKITRVAKNPANIDYDRRGVITKGAVIETPLGLARVTSRPGQHGILNAVLLGETKKS